MNNTSRLRRIRWPLAAIVCLFAVLAILWGVRFINGRSPAAAAPSTEEAAAAEETPAPTSAGAPKRVAEKLGIQIEGLRLAAGGAFLDFRYEVLDSAKAAAMLKQETENAYLVDETRGVKLTMPNANRSGSLHRAASELLGGHSYFMHFPNPGRQLTNGSMVTLVMGNVRIENLKVE
jgi:hypothetical protein